MATPRKLMKAQLQEISWTEGQGVRLIGDPVPVQFNPETLKVNFSNQKAGGDQRGGAATQFVGQGTTKLSFDLWLDVTAPAPEEQTETDVRRLTKKVVYFITPKKTDDDKFIAPGVRFEWGSFRFDGTMESVNETLDYFSEDGHPLRAQLSISLSQQEIQFEFGQQQSPGQGTTQPPGTQPTHAARAGETMQSIAADNGRAENWQGNALRNGVESPRHPEVGQPLSLGSGGASPSLGVQPPAPGC
jgi:hypothetical protein